ncbi:LmrA/YxaF family transcription factor [Robertmurraya kyonggiensis]|uniref:LmrA/YxaF family transcription factor n=1 Tax=Robertmurraya kyonggiensis TaxID=1037680 RepID=UPI003F66DA7D
MQGIYANKLVLDRFSKREAEEIALMMTAAIEGEMMLCLTQKASQPLKIITHEWDSKKHFHQCCIPCYQRR